MNIDNSILLMIFQFIVLTSFFIIEILHEPPAIIRGALFVSLFVTTGILLLQRINLKTKLSGMLVELKRASNGNYNTRLLANDDCLFDEVIFSINELIAQLEKIQVQTIKSEAARKRLLSNISHDIRTPLTSIIGYVDALKDDIAASREEQQKYLEIISRKASALKNVIDEIFDLAKLDADEIPLQPQVLDLAEIARESVIEFLPEINKCQMELRVSIPAKKCFLVADRLSLLRIIGNIIKNAVQYGKAGKVLGIELTEDTHEYQLSIWDKGPGISEDDLPYVFERMYRADQSRNLLNGGSGLGLAIAKVLVEKNGGSIWVESIPGEKTRFSFTLPKRNDGIN